jgi:hypothetical protein
VREWKELTGNCDRARQCLDRAKARAAKTTQDWLDCAKAANEVCSPVNPCLDCAEQAATSFSDWVACVKEHLAAIFPSSVPAVGPGPTGAVAPGAIDAKIFIMANAPQPDTNAEQPGHAAASRCLQSAKIHAKTSAQWRELAELWRRVPGKEGETQHCLEQAAIAENSLAPGGPVSPNLLFEAVYAFMGRLASSSHQDTPSDAAQYSRNGFFFYAACGNDWVPLYVFQCCDVFIYCDCGMELPQFADEIAFGSSHSPRRTRERLRLEAIHPIPQKLVDELAKQPAPPAEAMARQPWGRLVFFTCPGRSNPPRLLQLWFFAIAAETLYPNLFTRNRWAPEYICIKQNGAGLGEWRGPLGRQVEANPVQPRYVVMNNEHYNWPWNVVWQTFPDWEPFGPVHVDHRPEIQPPPGERERCLHLG